MTKPITCYAQLTGLSEGNICSTFGLLLKTMSNFVMEA